MMAKEYNVVVTKENERGEKMDNKGKKVLEEVGLLYHAPNCVEYWQIVKATADEVAQRIFEAMSDTVTVVRCKDCEFYKEEECWCRRLGLCGAFHPNDYCSHGERREDETS